MTQATQSHAELGYGAARAAAVLAGQPNADLRPCQDAVALKACFGVACLHHHRCARYAAVVDSEADAGTIGTCFKGNAYPLFIELDALRDAGAG